MLLFRFLRNFPMWICQDPFKDQTVTLQTLYIPYSFQKLHKATKSPTNNSFQDAGDQLCSLALIQNHLTLNSELISK